jgi:hypothetical protein
MNLHKILKIIAAVLSLVGAVLLAMIMSSGDDAIEAAYLSGGDTATVDNMIYVSYVIFLLVLAFVVIFVVKNLFSNTGSLKSTLMGAGAFVAVLVIAYLLSGGDTTEYLDQGVPVSEGTSQLVGAGIVSFYIFGALAIFSIFFSGIKKLTK